MVYYEEKMLFPLVTPPVEKLCCSNDGIDIDTLGRTYLHDSKTSEVFELHLNFIKNVKSSDHSDVIRKQADKSESN